MTSDPTRASSRKGDAVFTNLVPIGSHARLSLVAGAHGSTQGPEIRLQFGLRGW